MINGGGGEGSGKRRNNGGCVDNVQMLNEWAIKQDGKKKKKVAFLGREGNPLWYSKLSVCWCSLLVPISVLQWQGERRKKIGGGEGVRSAPEETHGWRDTGVREINKIVIIPQFIDF